MQTRSPTVPTETPLFERLAAAYVRGAARAEPEYVCYLQQG